MLQSKNSNAAANSICTSPIPSHPINNTKQAHITKRLEQLNRWQEDQKRLLHDRQNRQRELLGMEQESMYQMLGLRRDNSECDAQAIPQERPQNVNNGPELIGSENAEEYEEIEEYVDEAVEEEDVFEDSVSRLGTHDALNLLTSAYGKMASVALNCESQRKRPFLKKGEGLKQRFKIDPNEFRLNNLPRYKFANAHPRLALKPALKKPPHSQQPRLEQKKLNPSSLPPQALDLREQRFQQILLAQKNICNSTPETKVLSAVKKKFGCRSPSPTPSQQQANFNNEIPNGMKRQEYPPNQQSPQEHQSKVAWAQVLNSEQIPSKPELNKFYREPEESIFELLEQKAHEGSIDMNSPSIKQFMQRRLYEKLNNDIDDIPVQPELKNKPILPQVQDIATDTSSEFQDDESESTEEEDVVKDGSTNRTQETTSSSPTDSGCAEVRVRFTDSNETRVFKEDESIEEASRKAVSEMPNNNEFFQQFKEALFAALQIRPDLSLNDTTDPQSGLSDTTLTPKESFVINAAIQKATVELQEKTDMIKVRLADLEKEIRNFKENNVLLMKARQQHELEKTLHAQEHLEAMERVKEEKIQLEIYLHDERMKLEDDKRKFEQQIRTKAQSALAKERKDMEKLREQVTQMESQLKSKEQTHTAAQARVRCQVRNLEKEQKKLHEEIDRLTKENKRLESENLKISREQNNKLLQEINRNIAKLAPKQSSDEDSTGQRKSTISKTIVTASAANRLYRLLPKTYVSSPKKCAKVIRGGAPKSARKQKRLSAGSDLETETTMESSISDESKESNETINENQQQGCLTKQTQRQNLDICGDHNDNDVEFDDDILEELCLVPKRDNSLNKLIRPVSPPSKDVKVSQPPPPPPSQSPSEGKTETYQETTVSTIAPTNNLKREIVNEDGTRDIWYPNGNLKKISSDGMVIRMLYYNKDIKETNINEGTVKYYYAETNTWHTTYLDGLEVLEFPNGQVEHRHKNGLVEIHYPNNSVKVINPLDKLKAEEWQFADGTKLMQMRNGDRVLMLTNGQKEIHTKLSKRREYPDGTVKIVYPDGSQETRYSNGRVRLKDKDGKLVMDTEAANNHAT